MYVCMYERSDIISPPGSVPARNISSFIVLMLAAAAGCIMKTLIMLSTEFASRVRIAIAENNAAYFKHNFTLIKILWLR